jgi:hypothetical protein
MLSLVALVRTDVSEEPSASIIRATRIGTHFVFLRSMHQLLVTANVVPSSPILVTLMMEELSSSETSVLTRATRRNIQEDTLLLVVSVYYIHTMFLLALVSMTQRTTVNRYERENDFNTGYENLSLQDYVCHSSAHKSTIATLSS